jgi:ABC-type uncharacterized transport system substrate-binding protein
MKYILSLFIFSFSLFAHEQSFMDHKNHLQWQDTLSAQEKEEKWSMSNSYCRSLKLETKQDWRLPTIKELQTIISVVQNPSDEKKFHYSDENDYWTSEEFKEDDADAWAIHMGSGHLFHNDKCESAHVRCVRTLF